MSAALNIAGAAGSGLLRLRRKLGLPAFSIEPQFAGGKLHGDTLVFNAASSDGVISANLYRGSQTGPLVAVLQPGNVYTRTTLDYADLWLKIVLTGTGEFLNRNRIVWIKVDGPPLRLPTASEWHIEEARPEKPLYARVIVDPAYCAMAAAAGVYIVAVFVTKSPATPGTFPPDARINLTTGVRVTSFPRGQEGDRVYGWLYLTTSATGGSPFALTFDPEDPLHTYENLLPEDSVTFNEATGVLTHSLWASTAISTIIRFNDEHTFGGDDLEIPAGIVDPYSVLPPQIELVNGNVVQSRRALWAFAPNDASVREDQWLYGPNQEPTGITATSIPNAASGEYRRESKRGASRAVSSPVVIVASFTEEPVFFTGSSALIAAGTAPWTSNTPKSLWFAVVNPASTGLVNIMGLEVTSQRGLLLTSGAQQKPSLSVRGTNGSGAGLNLGNLNPGERAAFVFTTDVDVEGTSMLVRGRLHRNGAWEAPLATSVPYPAWDLTTPGFAIGARTASNQSSNRYHGHMWRGASWFGITADITADAALDALLNRATGALINPQASYDLLGPSAWDMWGPLAYWQSGAQRGTRGTFAHYSIAAGP